MQDGDHLGGVVHRKCGLRDERELAGVGRHDRTGLVRILHQGHRTLGQLAHRALHLRVPKMADHDDVPAGREVPLRFPMHFADQRAGGVEIGELAPLRLGGNGFRHPMGGKHDGRIGRHFGQILDEDGALVFQRFDHGAVVYDLMAHVDGRVIAAERLLDDADRAVAAGAETAWPGQQDVKGRVV